MVKKVLVIQTAFPGDLVLTTPLFAAIKKMDKTAYLSLLTLPGNAALFENSPFIDDLLLYDKKDAEKGLLPFIHLVKKIRKKKYDVALIPHSSLRSALVACFSGAATRVGFANRWCSFLYTDAVKVDGVNHEVERNLRLLGIFGEYDATTKPRLFPSRADSQFVTELLSPSGLAAKGSFVAVSPGSTWPTKAFPLDQYNRLIDAISKTHPIVLTGGEEDCELCESLAVCKGKTSANPVISIAGRTNLLQSAEVISRAKILISGDSAPVHIASAVGTPVVVIYGPTVPEFGFYPYAVPYKVVQKKLPCRPCSPHGPMKCPLGHLRCMIDIDADEVYSAACELMKENEAAHGRTGNGAE